MTPLRPARIAAATAILALLPAFASSETRQCTGTRITVSADEAAHTELACEAAAQAAPLFAACGLPDIPEPLRIDILDTLQPGCLGLYHRNEPLIEVLAPPALQTRREPEGVLSYLGADAHFQSIIVHELAHAATDPLPCPYEQCVSALEYIAYVMQVKSLDDAALAVFEEDLRMDELMARDTLNPLIMYMAPTVFAHRAWVHFNQQEDPCGFIEQLVRGEVFIDVDVFQAE